MCCVPAMKPAQALRLCWWETYGWIIQTSAGHGLWVHACSGMCTVRTITCAVLLWGETCMEVLGASEACCRAA